MTWWRKASPEDEANSNASSNPWVIDGWLQLKSMWRKASPEDEANSNASSNPWVIDGWLRIKSAWRHEGGGIWTRIFGSTGLPTAKIPYPELYFIWPDGQLTIDSPINGSKMFVERGAWTEEPNEFRIRIQEKAPGGNWTAIYDFTKTYEEYLDSDTYDRFPSNANDSSRPIITKAKTRAGYQFRGKVDATTPTDFTNFYDTEPMMPRMDFLIADFIVYDETGDGATLFWSLSTLVSGNTLDPSLDIASQKINIYDSEGLLVTSKIVSPEINTYILSDPILEPNTTYELELEVVGLDGYSDLTDKTAEYAYATLTTIIDKPEIITSPSFTFQSGEQNKRNSIYRLSSGTWTNSPTQYRYTIELNDAAGSIIAYYPSSTGYTTDTYYDHQFTSLTSTTVTGSVIANNGVDSLPAYSSNSVGPITELQYTVTYDGNGGTPARSSDVVNYGSSVNLPSASRTGYTFDGWYTAVTGGTFLGNPGTSYTPTASTTIYARWTAITYTVTWNANGGSVTPNSSSGVWGQIITAPTPTRTGYDFVYWRNPATGDMLYNINAGASWTINGTITFTAVWTLKQHTITFDEQGGSNVNDITANYGSAIQLPSTSRTGYTLDGWYTAPAGGTFLGHPGTNYTVTSDATIYARWSVINYTVTWNPNGGSVSPTSSSGAFGDVVIAPTPTRSGYTFVYWRNPATGDMLYNINAGSSWTINGSITFTAVWTIQQYTVTYNANGGSVSPASETVNAGSSVYLPSPSRSGYSFNGWYTAASGGTYLGQGNTQYTPSSSVTIYAQWSINQYTVTWNANGGSVTPTSDTVNAGSSVTAPTPTRSGYSFVRWTDTPSGDYTYTVLAGGSFTPPYTITMYARWQQDTVTYYTGTSTCNALSGCYSVAPTASGPTTTTGSMPADTLTGTSSARVKTVYRSTYAAALTDAANASCVVCSTTTAAPTTTTTAAATTTTTTKAPTTTTTTTTTTAAPAAGTLCTSTDVAIQCCSSTGCNNGFSWCSSGSSCSSGAANRCYDINYGCA